MRSSLADAAFAVEERVVWGGVDVLRKAFEVVKWPFERAAWTIERGLVWPLEERTGEWRGPLRTAGIAALAFFAVGAGVAGLLWASGSGGGNAPIAQRTVAPAPAPIVKQAAREKPTQAPPALHGAAPSFAAEAGDAASKAGGSTTAKAGGEAADATAAATPDTSPSSSGGASSAGESAGPGAAKVAHEFASAFVLYEVGKTDAKVREAFAATASPRLTHSLLQRPPRLPADAKVPKAKVLNIVPGPRHGNTYSLSVSLLRVGVTSELRLSMQRNEKSGQWQVVDARG